MSSSLQSTDSNLCRMVAVIRSPLNGALPGQGPFPSRAIWSRNPDFMEATCSLSPGPGVLPPTAQSGGSFLGLPAPHVLLNLMETTSDISRMPSPRLFGFRPSKKWSAHSDNEPTTKDPIESLADKVFDTAREVPQSSAWGLSPAESYLQRRVRPRE
jgi:hypothetical protein